MRRGDSVDDGLSLPLTQSRDDLLERAGAAPGRGTYLALPHPGGPRRRNVGGRKMGRRGGHSPSPDGLEFSTIAVDVESSHSEFSDDDDDDDDYFKHRTDEDMEEEMRTKGLSLKQIQEQKGKKKKDPFPFKRLMELAASEKRTLILGMVALLFGVSSSLALPYLAGQILDATLVLAGPNAVQGGSFSGLPSPSGETPSCGNTTSAPEASDEMKAAAEDQLRQIAVIIAILVTIASIGTSVRAYLFTISGERVVLRLRRQLFNSLVVQEIAFFDRTKTGELLNRLSNDCTVMQNTVTVNLSMGLRAIVNLLGGITMIFVISWKLTLVMLATVPAIVILSVVYGLWIKKISKAFQDALGKSGEVASDALTNIRTVRSFGQERGEMARYASSIDQAYLLAKKRSIGYGTLSGGSSFFANVALGAVLWYGGSLVVAGELSIGALSAFVMYAISVGVGLGMLTSLYSDLMKAVGASHRVFALCDRRTRVRWTGEEGAEVATARPPESAQERIKGHLVMDRVSFSYPARKDVEVLRDVSFKLEPGKVLALVGPSGGGKSTCVALMQEFYYPTSGRVLLDGRDIREMDPAVLRRNIAIVSQEPVLFATSIRENISYGLHRVEGEEPIDITDAEIERAAKVAHCHDFITDFPEGYDTLVGERGVRLSGGQKQRIAIARAVLMDPAVLLLDEATSALDAESEFLVQKALDELIRGRTVLVVAHRLSTVKSADCVVVIDGGTVAETGTHDELVDIEDGIYRQLVRRQLQHSEKLNG